MTNCFAETSPFNERIQAGLGAGRSRIRLHQIVNLTGASVDIIIDYLVIEAFRSSN